MAQEQLREVHELVVEQKQQRSSRASDVFCLLPFMRFGGGALDGDEERRTPGVRDARECAWQQLAASFAGPEGPDGSSSHSSS